MLVDKDGCDPVLNGARQVLVVGAMNVVSREDFYAYRCRSVVMIDDKKIFPSKITPPVDGEQSQLSRCCVHGRLAPNTTCLLTNDLV